MTGLIRKATLLSACGMLLATAAMAGIPSAANSTAPTNIRLVGYVGTAPDSAAGKFSVTVRDAGNNPINASNVVVDFSGCVDNKVSSNQLNANYTLNCPAKTVAAYTNTSGIVAFTLLGGSTGNTGPFSVASCSKLFADGVLLSSPTVAIFNLDNAGGVNAGDAAVLASDIGAHVYRARTDYDINLTVNAADLAVMATEIGTHKSDGAAFAACP